MSKAKEALTHILKAARCLIVVVSDEKTTPIAGEKKPEASASNQNKAVKPESISETKWRKGVDIATLTFQLFTLIVAIAFAKIYLGQWEAARRQADAAFGQLQEMQVQRKLDERAWVFPYEVVLQREQGNILHFYVHVKNSGKTPASNVANCTGTFYMPYGTGSEKEASDYIATHEPKETPYQSVQYPGQETTIEKTLQDPNKNVYILGNFFYDDVFGGHHFTKFCYVLPAGGKIPLLAGIYNFTDDNLANQTK
jgi:hypothetical protein